MLEIGHSNEPPSKYKKRSDVEVEVGREVPLAKSEDSGTPGDHHRGAYEAFDIFTGGGVFPHSLQRQEGSQRSRIGRLTSEGMGMKWLPSGEPKR